MLRELRSAGLQEPADMHNSLMLLHSYLIVKVKLSSE